MIAAIAVCAMLAVDGGAVKQPVARVRPNVVVAFKKGVTEAQARAVLEPLGVPFHPGSDSSRGKVFFYSHGPQFLLTVEPGKVTATIAKLRQSQRVAEAWEADWAITKD